MKYSQLSKELRRLRGILVPNAEKVASLERTLAKTRTRLERQRRKEDQQRRRAERLQAYLWEAQRPEGSLTSAFLRAYHEAGWTGGGTWKDTYWMGVPVWKLPLDLWIYQEILYETRPDLIIETGTANGGSALYLASICDLLNTGKVLTIDIAERSLSGAEKPSHPRIRYLLGSSTDAAIVDEVRREAEGAERIMVVLDSDHSAGHVFAELEAYAPLVHIGGYLVVEDTVLNAHPLYSDEGPGPMEAVEAFLHKDSRFEADRTKEKLQLTFNPKGYLRRVR